MSYIYIIHHKISENFKIGSTKNFKKRICCYITCFDNFDDKTHEIWVFKIIKSKFSCYQIDTLINKLSSKYGIPFIKYSGSGGTEYYKKDDFNKLKYFFNNLEIKYELNIINIEELTKNRRKQISNKTSTDIINFAEIANDILTTKNFIVKEKKEKKLKITDDEYKQKILEAKDVDNIDCIDKESYEYYKYNFKKFWNFKMITKKNLDLYFNCEYKYNRLLILLNKKTNNEYIDIYVNEKIEVIKNIINTLGFDLNNLTIKIPRNDYYKKIKVLLSNENSFKNNYDKIRILFDKNKHNLNKNTTESAINKILNGILDFFGLKIIKKQIRKSVKKVITKTNIFMLMIKPKYNI